MTDAAFEKLTGDLFGLIVAKAEAHPAPPKKSQLGQFFTPPPVASFMASLFPRMGGDIQLLDAGAGNGSLTVAFLERWRSEGAAGHVQAHAYEFDGHVSAELADKLNRAAEGAPISASVFDGDFIERAATMIRLGRGARYTHAILNPPYKKINNGSQHRALLRAVGLETVNLYSGFVGLALELMRPGGQLVAIIPRSFCNGPYYEPFRHFALERAAVRHIHLFGSRNKAFKADGVLQENVIVRLERGAAQGDVVISTSRDATFGDYEEITYPFDRIVFPGDDARFIHIPTGPDKMLLEAAALSWSLADLGLKVSTGPVVDFRMRADLRADPEPGTVPLLYPGHFSGDGLSWPRPGFRKPNAIRLSKETERWLYPNGFYAVVRRFSSKEERRRIVANVVDPRRLEGELLGFENHLNVFHEGRKPLTEVLAYGLATYLNATAVDDYFRRFNGHTQVNATDLRSMGYPSRDALIELGSWAMSTNDLSQEAIDAKVAALA